MRNVILNPSCCLIVPPIYSLICKGCRNEECRYALLLLAMEVISFILDLLGGSHWGYLLASLILSVLILETTIHASLIKRPRINSDGHEQHIVMEIVFSILQLIISCYCLIRTLSGLKSNFIISSSLFPLAYAVISVWFSFKNENNFSLSHLSSASNHTYQLELSNIVVDPSNTPTDQIENENDVSHQSSSSNHVGSENHKERLELNNNILVDLSNASQLSNINEVGPSDQAFDSVPTNDANEIPLGSTLRQRKKPSEPEDIKTTKSLSSPCGACKILRRRCDQSCVFAPYFPPDQPQKFIKVHRVFGASNVVKMLQELPFSQREQAVNSLEYEAEMRLQNPVHGCVGIIIQKLIEVIFSKVLTTADVTDELVIPTEALEHIPMVEGQQYVVLLVKGSSERQWKLGCRICSRICPKPVLTSGWLEFVKENGVTMGDTVTLSKQNDDGGQYRLQVKNETRSLDFYVDFHHS